MKVDHQLLFWNKVCEQWSDIQIERKKNTIRKYILEQSACSSYRWAIWRRISALHSTAANISYENYLNMEAPEHVTVQIQLDVPRTFPEIPLFATETMKQKLYNVLYAMSNYDIQVGYCQGQSFIAGTLLTVLSEEHTFQLLVTLHERYDLHRLFIHSFPKFKEVTFVFNTLLKQKLPKIHKHLKTLQVDTDYFLPKWIMTIFCIDFNNDFVLKIWDLFLLSGWTIVYQIALSIFKVEAKKILRIMSLEQFMVFIAAVPEQTHSLQYQNNLLSQLTKPICTETDISKLISLYTRNTLRNANSTFHL
jgi:hypothetical protein